MREERVPAGLRRFVSELGGPSFKEAAVTEANRRGVPGPGRAGASVRIPQADAAFLPSPPWPEHNPTSAGDTWDIELWYRRDL